MSVTSWKSTSLRASPRGGVRTGLMLSKAMVPMLDGDLSGPAPTLSPSYKTYARGLSDGRADCEKARREGRLLLAAFVTVSTASEYERGYHDGYRQCAAMVVTPATSAAMLQAPPTPSVSRFFTNAPLSQQQQQYSGPSQGPLLRITLPTTPPGGGGVGTNPDDYKNGFALGADDCRRSFRRGLAAGLSDDFNRGYLAGRMSCTEGSSGGAMYSGGSGGYIPPQGTK